MLTNKDGSLKTFATLKEAHNAARTISDHGDGVFIAADMGEEFGFILVRVAD